MQALACLLPPNIWCTLCTATGLGNHGPHRTPPFSHHLPSCVWPRPPQVPSTKISNVICVSLWWITQLDTSKRLSLDWTALPCHNVKLDTPEAGTVSHSLGPEAHPLSTYCLLPFITHTFLSAGWAVLLRLSGWIGLRNCCIYCFTHFKTLPCEPLFLPACHYC